MAKYYCPWCQNEAEWIGQVDTKCTSCSDQLDQEFHHRGALAGHLAHRRAVALYNDRFVVRPPPAVGPS